MYFGCGWTIGIIIRMTQRRHSPIEIKTTAAHLCSTSSRLKILGHLPFFNGLSESDLAQANLMFHEQDYHEGDIICLSGDPAEHLFVVADGRVKLLHHSLSGKDILLDLLTPGEFFGALSGLGGDVYPDTAQALSACCILVISKDAFQRIIQQHPTVALKVIDIMSRRLQAANERVHLLSTLPVESRIAYLLLKLGAKFGEKQDIGLLLQVPLSRDDLAGMIGTTTESASRVMSQFQKEGLIRSGRGWVALTDQKGLESIAGKEV